MKNQTTKKAEGRESLKGLYRKWKNYREMKERESLNNTQKKSRKGCVFCWNTKRNDDYITKETVEELTQMLEEYKKKIGAE